MLISQRIFPSYVFLLFVTLLIWADTPICGDSWPQFRGTDGSGIAPDSARPAVDWDLQKNTLWQADVPGIGWSSPVFDDGRIWLTTAVTTKATPEQIEAKRKGATDPKIKTVAASVEFRALCYELETGKILHNIGLSIVAEPELINPLNSYASPTPAIRDGKVVCHFGNYGTWCLNSDSGKIIWQVKYVVDHSVGPGSSPVITDNKVILACDGTDKQFVVAVDLETGEQKWLTQRPPIVDDNPEYRKSYCTPLVVEIAGKAQAIIPCAKWIAAYEPGTGKEIWRANHGSGFSIAPMAVYESGLIIFSTGYLKPEYVAVDPTGFGDVTKTHIKWRSPGAPTMPSLVASNSQIIAISEKGILNRLDAATGKSLERIRIGGNHSASPILAGSHLYFCSREGMVTVVANVEPFEKVATNRFESQILASPAVFGNDLIIRTEKKLFRIGP